MSMLAEKRRKTKYVINPTKKPLWTTDNSGIKFGKELMEKMGWSAGKGLGANEQGIQEPLKVSYKNDSKGMGYKGNEENWIEYQDEFNVLLNQLASNAEYNVKLNESEKVMSLEEKSKHSKARMHYQKFTRGKDLSKYSEKDLSCILGTSKSKKKEKEIPVEEEMSNVGNTYETSFGVTTINSGSIKDYFKKKWTNNSCNNLKSENSDVGQCGEGSKNEEVAEKKNSKKRDREDENGVEDNEIKKHKKKRKKRDSESVTDGVEDVCKVKKKKKKKREWEELESAEGRGDEGKVNVEEEVEDSIKKKKKKRGNILPETECSVVEEKSKKKKKKKKKEKNSEMCVEEEIEVKREKKKKKKKKESRLENERDETKNGKDGGAEDQRGGLIHTHKVDLFQMKKPLVDGIEKCSPSKAMILFCGAEIEKFKGSNLGRIPGYGCRKRMKDAGER